jgi:hypothetical protein
MPEIKAAFLNPQNFFDITASDLTTDLEFTLAAGWREARP